MNFMDFTNLGACVMMRSTLLRSPEREDKKCVSHFCKTALFPWVVRGALVECFEDLVGPALCEEIRGNDPRGADCEAVEI